MENNMIILLELAKKFKLEPHLMFFIDEELYYVVVDGCEWSSKNSFKECLRTAIEELKEWEEM